MRKGCLRGDGTRLMPRGLASWTPERLIIALVAWLGTTTCIGLLGGLVGVTSTTFLSAVAVHLIGVVLGACVTLPAAKLKSDDRSFFAPTLGVPILFFVSSARWLIRPAGARLEWFLGTWDATTNPGIVTYSLVTGNIGDRRATISQWDTYPRAPHFAIGQLSRIAEGFGFDSAVDRATIYALGLWFTYAVLIAAVGVTLVCLARAIGTDHRVASAASIVAQSFMMLSINLDKTLLLHSLSFLACIATCLSLFIVWLVIAREEFISWRGLLIVSLHVVVVIETYPLLLPFVAVVLAVMILQFKMRLPFHSWSGMMALVAPLAIAAPRLIDHLHFAVAVDQVAAGGHLIALPVGEAITCGAVGLTAVLLLGFHRPLGRRAAAVLLGALIVPIVSWVMVGNFDRTYGMNYYPKKVELFALAVVVAMAPVALISRVGFLTKKLHSKKSGLVLVLIVSLAVWSGPLTTPSVNSGRNSARPYVEAALAEADNPSEVVIQGRDVMLSTYATMLSNQLDKRYWSTGYNGDRLVVMFQQLSVVKRNTPALKLCRYVSRRPAEVIILEKGTTTRVACDA